MKTVLALILLGLSQTADAVPIFYEQPPETTHVYTPGATLVGYERITTGRYWTWHGKARKYGYTPLYSTAAPIPEPKTYIMLLAGLGIVAAKVAWRRA